MNDACEEVEFQLGFHHSIRNTNWNGHEKYTPIILLLLPLISFSTEDTNK